MAELRAPYSDTGVRSMSALRESGAYGVLSLSNEKEAS